MYWFVFVKVDEREVIAALGYTAGSETISAS